MRVELRQRLLFGSLIGAFLLVVLTWDVVSDRHWGAVVLGVAAVVLAAREFRRLTVNRAIHARLAPLVVVSVGLVFEAHLHDPWWCPAGAGDAVKRLAGSPVVPLLLGLGMFWTALAQMQRYATDQFIASMGATTFGMLYLGVSFNLLERLALLDATPSYYLAQAEPANRGGMLLLLLLATVKFGDIAAYFGGRAFGRHRLSPRISPGKTWEGFAFSFIGAVGGTYLFTALFAWGLGASPFYGWWQPLVWGLILGPVGVAGDLVESALKRDAAVKDSGTLVPGFGGWLDLADALIIAAPVAYLLAMVL